MNSKVALVVLIGFALLCCFHYQGSNSMFPIVGAPVYMTFIIAAVNFPLYRLYFRNTIIYNYSLLLVNDSILMGIPFGATPDSVGQGFILIFFLAAFVLATIAMLIYAYFFGPRDSRGENKNENIGYLIVVISGGAAFVIDIFFRSQL